MEPEYRSSSSHENWASKMKCVIRVKFRAEFEGSYFKITHKVCNILVRVRNF